MAAPLLRELLLGTPRPLMDVVNAQFRLKLRFRFRQVTPPWDVDESFPKPLIWVRGTTLYEGINNPARDQVTLPRDAFLAEPMIWFGEETPTRLSVRDVIDYMANAAGAVHFGDMTKGRRETLRLVDELVTLGGYGAALHSLKAIGRVTVAGLQPLAEAVSNDRQDE